jgi:hypothetical protein
VGRLSATTLYASSIAIVSGAYAISSPLVATMRAPTMTDLQDALGIGGWIMLGVGIVVLLHGVVLLTPASPRLHRSSGPLMLVWAAIMLVNQLLIAVVPGFGMAGTRTGEMMSPLTEGMSWDGGMVAIAILMLASGLIMTSRGSSDAAM